MHAASLREKILQVLKNCIYFVTKVNGNGCDSSASCGMGLVCAARGEVCEGIHTELFLYIKNGLCENYWNTFVKKENKTKPQTPLLLGLAI